MKRAALPTHTKSAVLLHDEELSHPELIRGKTHIGIHKSEASVLAIHQEEMRAQSWISQVALDSDETKLTMLIEVLRPEVCHVVLVQLKQLLQDELV